jgi:vacuolar-type H+-ATPase subunit F/Vma7
MKIFVIGDFETVLAFGLAGIKGQTVRSGADLPAVLEGLDREQTGLVLITEALAEANREVMDKMLLVSGGPLMLEIPDVNGPLSGKAGATERIVSLLKR